MEDRVAEPERVAVSDAGPRFVSIQYFWKEMLGMKSKMWWHIHVDDPDMPQRVYPTEGGRPMLVYDECVAYMRRRMAARAAKPKPKKRHPGRPAKQARS